MGGKEQSGAWIAEDRFHLLKLLPKSEEFLVLRVGGNANLLGGRLGRQLGFLLEFLGVLGKSLHFGAGVGADSLGFFDAVVAVFGGFHVAFADDAAEDRVAHLG